MSSTPAEAVRSLRAAAQGHLLADADTVRPVRWVFDRRRGTLVFPVPGEFEDLVEAQLLVPEEHDPRLAVLLSLDVTDTPPPAAEIRHEVYHGPAREARWAVATIEALRYHGEAFDRDELALTDPLADHEPALCRAINNDTEALRAVCETHAGTRVETPVAVGVDPDGIDVRARFGIVRVEFDTAATTPDQARQQLDALREAARA